MKKLIAAALLGITTTTKAMTITDNLIVWECPHCGAKASEAEISSFNTFGARFWSDGFRIAPMAPTQDIVSRCWKCKKVFCKWGAKSKIVPEEKVAKEDRRYVGWVGSYSAVKEVLDESKGMADESLECELRLRMLWATNHRTREGADDYRKESDDYRGFAKTLKGEDVAVAEVRENMAKLSASTNLPPWLRAEVLREMGKFDAAKKMMDEFAKSNPSDFKDGEGYFKEILERIKNKDVKVFKR